MPKLRNYWLIKPVGALVDMYGVLEPVHERGAEVEFVLWTSRGAITMVSHRRVKRGGARHGSLSLDALRSSIKRPSLRTFVGTHDRYLTILVRRERRGWRWLRTSTTPPKQHPIYPAEGRSVPMHMTGVMPVARAGIFRGVRGLSGFLDVPVHGSAVMRFDAVFDDERVLSTKVDNYSAEISETVAGYAAVDEPSIFRRVRGALMPFAHGLGERTVRVELSGTHAVGEREARWTVTHARVRRASPRTDIAYELIRDYRHQHERMIVRWRRGVRDSAVMVAGFTMEQVALWVVGGWLVKAAGAALRPLAPRLLATLRWFGRKGKKAAAEFLETQLTRLPKADKDVLYRLMVKAETEGISALNAAERAEFELLVKRVETSLVVPLMRKEKKRLRHAMYRRYASVYPEVLAAFKQARIYKEIHHRIPLEWAHRLPGFDINSIDNLVAMNRVAHQAASAVWTRLRTAPAGRVTRAHVQRVAQIVDRHFKHWYNKLPEQHGLDAAIQW